MMISIKPANSYRILGCETTYSSLVFELAHILLWDPMEPSKELLTTYDAGLRQLVILY